jgi:hypothetical protein
MHAFMRVVRSSEFFQRDPPNVPVLNMRSIFVVSSDLVMRFISFQDPVGLFLALAVALARRILVIVVPLFVAAAAIAVVVVAVVMQIPALLDAVGLPLVLASLEADAVRPSFAARMAIRTQVVVLLPFHQVDRCQGLILSIYRVSSFRMKNSIDSCFLVRSV